MDDLHQLEHLSLVSRIVTELENHFGNFILIIPFTRYITLCFPGIAEKEVAEFIIDLAKKSRSFDKFKRMLSEQGLDDGV